MKVLVTGGTGHLGRAVTQAAAAAGYHVRIMSRHDQSRSLASDFEWAQANLSSGEGVRQAVAGTDAVLHLASDPRRPREVDVGGTLKLIEAARFSGIAHLVYISIVGIDQIPYSYYKRKLDAEEIIKSSGLPYSILRATQFHSLIDLFLGALARFPLVTPLPSDFKFQSVAESEVADLLVRQIGKGPGGKVADFGGPEVLTLGKMAEMWMEIKKLRQKIIHVPLPGRVAAGFRAGKNTAPDEPRGMIRWQDWLIQKYRS